MFPPMLVIYHLLLSPTACPSILCSVLLGLECYKLPFPDTLASGLVMLCQEEEMLEY